MDVSDSESDNDSLASYSDKDITYKVLKIDDVNRKMEQVIHEIVSETKLLPSIARIALCCYGWDKWILFKEFYHDRDTFFKNIRVVNPLQEVAATSTAFTRSIDNADCTGECPTCCEQSNALVGLSCNHMFCRDCWSRYLTVKINEGFELISCQSPNCFIIVDGPRIDQLLLDENIKARYKKLITNSFVLSDEQPLEWCPGVDCTNAIEVSNMPIHRLDCTCECGHEFCFKCRAAHHEPMPCGLFEKWQNQSADPTLRYLLENTKPCPKCRCLIEKNQGCNYMHCTRCHEMFCWYCLKQCSHGECKTPQEKILSGNYDVIRYQRYKGLYESHQKLYDADKKSIRNKFDRINVSLGREGMIQSDINKLQRSFDILLACRKCLMMSCIFAYFVTDGENEEKAVFEENQRNLENGARLLSLYLKSDKTYQKFADVNDKISIRTKSCARYRTILHDHISDGLDRQW